MQEILSDFRQIGKQQKLLNSKKFQIYGKQFADYIYTSLECKGQMGRSSQEGWPSEKLSQWLRPQQSSLLRELIVCSVQE